MAQQILPLEGILIKITNLDFFLQPLRPCYDLAHLKIQVAEVIR